MDNQNKKKKFGGQKGTYLKSISPDNKIIIKDTDVRFTSNEVFKKLKELTGIDWKKGYDPTPRNAKSNTFNKPWNKATIFLNPPFSKSKIFVEKLVTDMEQYKQVKRALIILPWYQVECVETRVTGCSKWFRKLRPRMSKLKFKKYHLKNQKFLKPDGGSILVRVYAIYLSR